MKQAELRKPTISIQEDEVIIRFPKSFITNYSQPEEIEILVTDNDIG